MKPIAFVLTLAVTGCASPQSTVRPATEPSGATLAQPAVDTAESCAFGVKATKVVYNETASGAILTLTTRSNVTELQQRAANVASQHGPGMRMGAGHDGEHGLAHGHGLMPAAMPPMRVEVENIIGGARLTIDARDPADIVKLKDRLRIRVAEMRKTTCD
jgi:hypothetical protein